MLARFRSLLRTILRRSSLEREMAEELQFHIESRADHLAAAGVPRPEALRRARLEFGGIEATKERCREERGAGWPDELARNLHYSLRSIRHSPGFAAIAVLSLTIGIGANIAIFSLLHKLILSPLPVRDPYGLHQLVLSSSKQDYYAISYPKFEMLRDNFPIFNGLFGWGTRQRQTIISGTRSLESAIVFVTGDYFQVLGIQPALGRLIHAQDDSPGEASDVAVLSHSLWMNMFQGDRSVLSKTVTINRVPYRIIGVAPPTFYGAEPAIRPGLYLPVHAITHGSPKILTSEGSMWMHFMARLKPGVSLAAAKALLRDGWPRFSKPRQKFLGDNSRPEIFLLEDGSHGFSDVRNEFSRPVVALMALVAVVFLVACANLATLLLVRGTRRARETAVRTALGASRAQLLRQWMTECLLLACTAGFAGLLAARWITALLLYFVPENGRADLQFTAGWPVLAFTVGLTLAAGLLFGLLPSLRFSRIDPESVLRGGTSAGRGRVAEFVLAAQMAALLVLVAGAIFFARTLWNLNQTPGGFTRQTVIYAQPAFWRASVPQDRVPGLMQQIVARVAASPRIASIAMGTPPVVFGGGGGWGWVVVSGYKFAPNEDNRIDTMDAAPGYFRTLEIPVLAGREFEDRDLTDQWPPHVVIVNESFAKHYFTGRTAIGQTVKTGPNPPMEIIGVVGDSKSASLRERQKELLYYPAKWDALIVRTKPGVPASPALAEVRAAFSAVQKGVPLESGVLEDGIQKSLNRDRFVAELSAVFGLLGVLLASVGLYAAIAQTVAGRTREIGVRIALGATPWRILHLICRQSFRVTALGILIGIPLAAASSKLVESLLFGVAPADPLTLTAAAALLAIVGLLAGLAPARRAAGMDPTRALRYE